MPYLVFSIQCVLLSSLFSCLFSLVSFLTSLFLLVRVQDLKESLVGLRLVAEALLDGGDVRDRVVELGRLT